MNVVNKYSQVLSGLDLKSIKYWRYKMETLFKITNKISGHVLGLYAATTESQALDIMAQDAGYTDYAECCQVTGSVGDDMQVIEIPHGV